MDRKELLQQLALAAPALAPESENIIPAFSGFCFDGTQVVAYNDVVAASVPLETTFKGIVPGQQLLSFVKTATGKPIELNPAEGKKDQLHVKCGSAKLTLPILNAKEYPFQFPTLHGELILDLNAEFFTALALCSKIVTPQGLTTWLGGILFDFGKGLRLCSVGEGRAAMASYLLNSLKLPNKVTTFVLPVAFSKLVLSMVDAYGTKGAKLCIRDKYVAVYFASNAAAFGRVIAGDRPNVVGKIRGFIKNAEGLVAVPQSLRNAVKRAIVVSDPNKPSTITIKEDKLRLRSYVKGGGVLDGVCSLEGKHNEIKVEVFAKAFGRMLDVCTEFHVFETHVLMRAGAFVFITATINK